MIVAEWQDNPHVATVHNNIGNVLRQQGRLEEAMVEYQKALRSYRAALGNDHPWCVLSPRR